MSEGSKVRSRLEDGIASSGNAPSVCRATLPTGPDRPTAQLVNDG